MFNRLDWIEAISEARLEDLELLDAVETEEKREREDEAEDEPQLKKRPKL